MEGYVRVWEVKSNGKDMLQRCVTRVLFVDSMSHGMLECMNAGAGRANRLTLAV